MTASRKFTRSKKRDYSAIGETVANAMLTHKCNRVVVENIDGRIQVRPHTGRVDLPEGFVQAILVALVEAVENDTGERASALEAIAAFADHHEVNPELMLELAEPGDCAVISNPLPTHTEATYAGVNAEWYLSDLDRAEVDKMGLDEAIRLAKIRRAAAGDPS